MLSSCRPPGLRPSSPLGADRAGAGREASSTCPVFPPEQTPLRCEINPKQPVAGAKQDPMKTLTCPSLLPGRALVDSDSHRLQPHCLSAQLLASSYNLPCQACTLTLDS